MISFFLTLSRLIKGIIHTFHDKEFKVLLILTIAIILSGTIFYHEVEHLSIIDSLYFSIVTLTTIGHPYFSPETTLGKIFTIIYIFTGIGLVIGFIQKISKGIFISKTKISKKGEE
ncbi:transporter [Heyndrickxia shackletonii]|uniref:Transporter n=1 Tax=Heyndrickxia shackletonii TaxID=157838 RepID=A0A0Q3WRB6_9BACI|nr:potassium channel family protein [Heyndrickxia shackletonii]KQL50396.1 transporter [Heyndrickxia shackletonii]MBB2479398.1 two pore domain potassium channel family protein [Bacillus sp. APMAM]NEZ00853.1 two pore domain potassium channel family protein [Heyndrickxia shackletonii]RTZ57027.1 two pore domain potassium channel family protein [Bacillus sp. SAJ1]